MHSVRWGLVLGFVFVTTASYAAPSWVADVPLQSCDGIPCVDAMVGNGVQGRFIIDTGDEVSLVDNADANAIGFGSGNLKNGQIVKAAHTAVVLGGAQIPSAPFIALALGDYVRKGTMPHSRGSLTYTAFRERVIQFDFVRRRFRMSAPLTTSVACDGHCAKLDLIKFGKNGPPILVGEGFLADGKSVRAQIDTVYTGGLLIYSLSMKALGFAAPPSAPKESFPFTDDRVDVLRGAQADVRFGNLALGHVPLYFPTPGVHEPDGYFEGTIGLVGLAGTVMTLDLHDQTIELERPATG
jgi:hypothetical protein